MVAFSVQRLIRAAVDGNLIGPRRIQDDRDIADYLVHEHIPADAGYGRDFMGRTRQGQQDGDGVIHPGVGINDQAGDRSTPRAVSWTN
jgi:hypothetical protein